MGIHLNKMIGYGLIDLQHENGKLTDPRINSAAPVLNYDDDYTALDYQLFLQERETDLDLWLLRDKSDDEARLSISGAIVRRAEYGLPNVLCIRPLSMRDWHRHDDPIDYIEESYLGPHADGPEDHVELLDYGIYPFSGSYMDDRTGERLPNTVMGWIRASGALKRGETALGQAELDLLARAAGLADHADAVAHVAPVVPNDVRNLAEFCELFTDETVWRQLRPLRYVWWA